MCKSNHSILLQSTKIIAVIENCDDISVTLTPYNCADKIDNCAEFDGGNLCTDNSYYVWAHENCFDYCGFPPCGSKCDVTGSWQLLLNS